MCLQVLKTRIHFDKRRSYVASIVHIELTFHVYVIEEESRSLLYVILKILVGIGSGNEAQQGDKRPRVSQEQACGECGKREGWRIPRGWTVIPTPAGTQGWTVETLLQEQERTGAMFRFRYGEFVLLCFVFSESLKRSVHWSQGVGTSDRLGE